MQRKFLKGGDETDSSGSEDERGYATRDDNGDEWSDSDIRLELSDQEISTDKEETDPTDTDSDADIDIHFSGREVETDTQDDRSSTDSLPSAALAHAAGRRREEYATRRKSEDAGKVTRKRRATTQTVSPFSKKRRTFGEIRDAAERQKRTIGSRKAQGGTTAPRLVTNYVEPKRTVGSNLSGGPKNVSPSPRSSRVALLPSDFQRLREQILAANKSAGSASSPRSSQEIRLTQRSVTNVAPSPRLNASTLSETQKRREQILAASRFAPRSLQENGPSQRSVANVAPSPRPSASVLLPSELQKQRERNLAIYGPLVANRVPTVGSRTDIPATPTDAPKRLAMLKQVERLRKTIPVTRALGWDASKIQHNTVSELYMMMFDDPRFVDALCQTKTGALWMALLANKHMGLFPDKDYKDCRELANLVSKDAGVSITLLDSLPEGTGKEIANIIGGRL
jgi:hypothetical protein